VFYNNAMMFDGGSMRHGIALLLVAGCVSSTALAVHRGTDGSSAGPACELLTRDLVVKVAPESSKKTLEREKPIDDPFAKDLQAAGQPVKPGTSCMYGPVMLVLEPMAQPAQALKSLQARTAPYQAFEPVAGVGDAAFFRANSATASMYVWSGARHFLVEIFTGFGDDARGLKPNSIELAKGIAAKLR
jgi:hypothetical protein